VKNFFFDQKEAKNFCFLRRRIVPGSGGMVQAGEGLKVFASFFQKRRRLLPSATISAD
jgi:hypothetical protein